MVGKIKMSLRIRESSNSKTREMLVSAWSQKKFNSTYNRNFNTFNYMHNTSNHF